MSSRLGMISAPSNVNGIGDALFQISNRDNQARRDSFLDARNERRYQLEMARQNSRDALAQSRIDLQEKRYNDEISRRDQKDRDTLAGMSYGLTSGFDPKMTGDVTTETEQNINMVTDIGADRMTKLIASDPEKYDSTKIIKNTKDDLKFEKEYNDLENKYDNKNELKLAQLELADKYNIKGKENSFLKAIPYGGAKIVESASGLGSYIADLGRTEKEEVKANMGRDKFGNWIEDTYGNKTQSDVVNEKLKSIKDIRSNRETKENIVNENLQALAKENTQNVLFKEKVTKHDVTLPRKEWNKNLRNGLDNAITNINSKDISITEKIESIKSIKAIAEKKDAIYESKQIASAKRTEKIWEKQLDTAAKKSLKQVQHELDMAEKAYEKDPEDTRIERRYKKARAQKEEYLRDKAKKDSK